MWRAEPGTTAKSAGWHWPFKNNRHFACGRRSVLRAARPRLSFCRKARVAATFWNSSTNFADDLFIASIKSGNDANRTEEVVRSTLTVGVQYICGTLHWKKVAVESYIPVSLHTHLDSPTSAPERVKHSTPLHKRKQNSADDKKAFRHLFDQGKSDKGTHQGESDSIPSGDHSRIPEKTRRSTASSAQFPCAKISSRGFKKAVKIIAGANKQDSCRSLFKKLAMLTITCQYIYSTITFVNYVHSFNTIGKGNLHLPSNHLTLVQIGAYFAGVKLFIKFSQILTHLDKKNSRVQLPVGWTPQSSAYWSLNCVSIGCCLTSGSYGIRKVFPCKSAIGSVAFRASLINCDPIAKLLAECPATHPYNVTSHHESVSPSILSSLPREMQLAPQRPTAPILADQQTRPADLRRGARQTHPCRSEGKPSQTANIFSTSYGTVGFDFRSMCRDSRHTTFDTPLLVVKGHIFSSSTRALGKVNGHSPSREECRARTNTPDERKHSHWPTRVMSEQVRGSWPCPRVARFSTNSDISHNVATLAVRRGRGNIHAHAHSASGERRHERRPRAGKQALRELLLGAARELVGAARPRSRSEGAIRATLTGTPSASSLLRARRAGFPSCKTCRVSVVTLYCAVQICDIGEWVLRLFGYRVLGKVPHRLGYRLTSRLPVADWRTAFRNARTGETGDSRENPPTSGTVPARFTLEEIRSL
ncbi:hypothetical protein PR048_001416 [Dryococelus australis]|uniref:Uncharacterized protein n=1 Tax=Dryococelus australis TaxID=614101 RepID=A0ABQ9IH91_9NEOP|nr:hypothetical protein PR048_001416 [Dryococelus australis]